MGTRSRIGLEHEDGTVTSVYCHWDGYLDHNGRILLEHYSDREKLKNLCALGDLSGLAPSIGHPEGHTFEHPVGGHCIFYGRDRGEEGIDSLVDPHADAYWGRGEEYQYLFTKDGEWLYSNGHGGWTRPLKDGLMRGVDLEDEE